MPDGAQDDWRARARGSRVGRAIVLATTTAVVLAGVWWGSRGKEPDAGSLTSSSVAAAPEAALGPGGGGSTPVQVSGSPGSAPIVGQPLADFTALAVDGRPVSLSALRGRPVWLSFGATWCAPCRVEAPDIQAAYAARAHDDRGLAVVAIYLGESAETVRDATSRLGLTYVHIADPATRLASAYRVLGIPTHVFLDRAGVVRGVVVGVLGPEEIARRVALIETG